VCVYASSPWVMCSRKEKKRDQFSMCWVFLVDKKKQKNIYICVRVCVQVLHGLYILAIALYLRKRDPYLLKRALYLLQKALLILKRDLHLFKRALCILTRDAYISVFLLCREHLKYSERPHAYSKETYIHSKEPYIYSKEPYAF